MNFTPPRQDTSASIVGGLLGGLVVAGSIIAFFSLRDPRGNTEEVTELRLAVAELRAQTADLRAQIASQPPAPPAPPQMMMFAPPTPPAPPSIEINMPPPPTSRAEDAISCHAENSCTIDRRYLEELIASPAELSRQMRVIPSVKDGVTRGIKLYGIRPGSLPNLLGYKNGDLILRINGQAPTSAEATMSIYSRLRRTDTLSVEIERKGATMVKTCDLR